MIGMMMTPIRSGTFDCPFQLRWSRGARAGLAEEVGGGTTIAVRPPTRRIH